MDEKTRESAPKSLPFCNFLKGKSKAELKPVDPSNLVTVDQLPIYSEQYANYYKFLKTPPLPLQESVSKVRQTATEQYGTLKEQFKDADVYLQKGANVVSIREEWTTVPKAMAVVIGGMAGYILGMRRGFFRRWMFTGVGLTTMAAFSYPNEALAVCREGVIRAKKAWVDFQASPEPPVLRTKIAQPGKEVNATPEVGDSTPVAPVPELVDVTPISGTA